MAEQYLGAVGIHDNVNSKGMMELTVVRTYSLVGYKSHHRSTVYYVGG